MAFGKRTEDTDPRSSKIELGALIKEVVAQLKDARNTDGDAIMQLDTCDIELGVNVEKEGEAGVKVYAFTLGGSVSQTKQSTVTVRFKAISGTSDGTWLSGAPFARQGGGPLFAMSSEVLHGPPGRVTFEVHSPRDSGDKDAG
jgi:hypothetical protein